MSGTLQELIRNASIPLYHEDKWYKISTSGLRFFNGEDLLKFLTDTGIDITEKTPLSIAACKKYTLGNTYYNDEFYQRFSDIVWTCSKYKHDIKAIITTILNIDNIERFNKLWNFISTSYDYGVLDKFVAKNEHFIKTILNVESPDHLENVRRILIFCRDHLSEIISKKEQFIDDLLSIDPGALANCIYNLQFNDMMKHRSDQCLFNCENILVLLNEKKIKCYSELSHILKAINNQAEFNMLVEHASNLHFIYKSLLKANNSSNEFEEMLPERFSECLSNICSAARLLNNSSVFFNKNDKDIKRDVQDDKATSSFDKVVSRPGKSYSATNTG